MFFVVLLHNTCQIRVTGESQAQPLHSAGPAPPPRLLPSGAPSPPRLFPSGAPSPLRLHPSGAPSPPQLLPSGAALRCVSSPPARPAAMAPPLRHGGLLYLGTLESSIGGHPSRLSPSSSREHRPASKSISIFFLAVLIVAYGFKQIC